VLDPLPIKQDSGPGGNSAAITTLTNGGSDGFALYAALDAAGRAAGGNGNRLVSWPYDPRVIDASLYPVMSNQRVMLRPQLVKGGIQIDGVAWIQQTNGNYTANNNNKIGAYTYDGTQYTQVAQCANDGTLWQSGTGFRVKAFTTPYIPPADMLLWAAGIWCQSAVVTAPVICCDSVGAGGAAKNLGLQTGGVPGFAMASDVTAGPPTNLTATILDASIDNTNTNNHWLAFYHTY